MSADMILLRLLAGIASGRQGLALARFAELDHIELGLALAEARRAGFVAPSRDPVLTPEGRAWAAEMVEPLRPLMPDLPQAEVRQPSMFDRAAERRRIVREMTASGARADDIAESIGCTISRVYELRRQMRRESCPEPEPEAAE